MLLIINILTLVVRSVSPVKSSMTLFHTINKASLIFTDIVQKRAVSMYSIVFKLSSILELFFSLQV
jgi:hypothetical protein